MPRNPSSHVTLIAPPAATAASRRGPGFQRFIGIDYSGRETSESRLAGLQVYAADLETSPVRVPPPDTERGRHRHWCRQEIAAWLLEQTHTSDYFIAGIDHGFSFPMSYFQEYQLASWDDFLSDFVLHWPTHQAGISVESIRRARPLPVRTGSNRAFRLTETWTSSAKSVFQFDVQGSVAKSTHAGLAWIHHLRHSAGDRLHFWPFDGWDVPPGKHVLAEVYPSIFRNRYPREGRTVDQQDAFATARWLSDVETLREWPRYFHPPLTESQEQVAGLEGWILGVS